MEYESLKQMLESPQVVYTLGLVTSAALTGIGYLFGRSRVNRDLKLSAQETERARLGLETAKQTNAVQLKELDYANADSVHRRELELLETRQKGKRETLIALAQSLTPFLQQYMDSFKRISNPDQNTDPYEQKRHVFREELVGKLLEEYEDESGVFSDEICFEDDRLRIDELVELKYPSTYHRPEVPRLPQEVLRLVEILEKGIQE